MTRFIHLIIGFGAMCLFSLLNLAAMGGHYGVTMDIVMYSTIAYCTVYTFVILSYNPTEG